MLTSILQLSNTPIAQHADPSGKAFFEKVATYLPLKDRKNVELAFEMARREHGEDRRKSGELFFTHPLTVASYLADYYLDASALIAALLHDVAEDTSVSVEEITIQFGPDVGRIVDGLTKFDEVTAKAKLGRELSAEEVKTATIYKLLEMMTADMRVGIVKIFDRLHNMRTIRATPPHKQREKARETLTVYAPLANRLGMWKVKNELHQISLDILDHQRYTRLCQRLAERDETHQEIHASFAEEITAQLTEANLNVLRVVPAEEGIYKHYHNWVRDSDGGAQIQQDPPNMVVLLESPPDCYAAIYHIHRAWRPVPGAMKDYIGAPRSNLYRSLHTAIIYNGQPIKIQLRTLNMQIESQAGVLSQWHYKNSGLVWSMTSSKRIDDMMANIRVAIQTESKELGERVTQILDDVFSKQIIVYTPDGDLRELPEVATPIDFAYTIHTAVGNSCRGAFVNGHQVPLTYQLKDGDSVRIERYGTEPQRTWLDESLGYLYTSTAKTAVRRWFRRLATNKATAQGKRLLQHELGMLTQGNYPPEKVAEWFGCETPEALYNALGRAEILPTDVATKILTEVWTQQPQIPNGRTVRTPKGELILVDGAGDRDLHLCGTCSPRPGDPILGFIRRDGVVTIHCTACRTLNADVMMQGRSLRLRWGEEGQERGRPITLHINVHDRNDLLHDITRMMHEEQVNLTSVCASAKHHQASIMLTVAARSPRQIVSILHRIQALVNVINVAYLGAVDVNSTDFNPETCPFMVLNEGFCDMPHYLSQQGKSFVAK